MVSSLDETELQHLLTHSTKRHRVISSTHNQNNFPTISVDALVDTLWTTTNLPSGSVYYLA